MELVQKLVALAERLDGEGLIRLSRRLDEMAEGFVVRAQSIGSQGYWVRNERCYTNCYRQKRASSPDRPAQEVWFECQSEFQKQLNKQTDSWDKFAAQDDHGNLKFAQHVTNAVSEGYQFDETLRAIIAVAQREHRDDLIAASDALLTIAEDLEPYDREISVEAALIGDKMLKEAQLGKAVWDNTVGNKGVGGWLGNKFKNIGNDYRQNKTKKYQDWLAKNSPTGPAESGEASVAPTAPAGSSSTGVPAPGTAAPTSNPPAPASVTPATNSAPGTQTAVPAQPPGNNIRQMNDQQLNAQMKSIQQELNRRKSIANGGGGDMSRYFNQQPSTYQTKQTPASGAVSGVPVTTTSSTKLRNLFKI